MFGVTILGNNSAIPAFDRHPTSQVVTLNDQLFLIDCGEGTQMQIAKYKIRRSKIHHVFISHLHGDHYFGLIGLLTSLGLQGREAELTIYAPPELQEIINMQLRVAGTTLPFRLTFHALADDGILVDTPKFRVESFRTLHRIPCWGFVIREKKKPRKINRDKALEYAIPTSFYERLKDGEDYLNEDGKTVPNFNVTFANKAPRSYAYCADTKYYEHIADRAREVNLMYHEATYLKELEERAAARFHSTTSQAAMIASMGRVKKLIIGHFSSQYEDLNTFLHETRELFPNSDLAIEGVTYQIK